MKVPTIKLNALVVRDGLNPLMHGEGGGLYSVSPPELNINLHFTINIRFLYLQGFPDDPNLVVLQKKLETAKYLQKIKIITCIFIRERATFYPSHTWYLN